MRQASTLLGIMTIIILIGVYLAFHDKVEAPTHEDAGNGSDLIEN